jgi:hypothetical protein
VLRYDDLGVPDATVTQARSLGNDDSWAFALYDPATNTYPDTALPNGSTTGTPQQALDCACAVHLTDTPNQTTEPS